MSVLNEWGGYLKALGSWAAKAISSDEMRHSGRQSVFLNQLDPVDKTTMARDVGDGTSSDVLMTPVRWLQRAMVQAPMVVVDDDGAADPGNALQDLLDNPNEFYSMRHLLDATTFDLVVGGNAYWIPTQNLNDRTFELWHAQNHTMTPKWPDDGSVFISHYEYKPQGGGVIRLEPDEVIHFRNGFDPENDRLGLSPLRGLLREIWTDNEAAAFTAALLRNGGVPGLVISPRAQEDSIEPEEAEAIEARIESKVTRENRGKILVMSTHTRLEQFGFSPQQMDLSPLRDMSEERVTAALGVPAAVVGFGSGLASTKVGATMRELRQLAWWNGVIPLQSIIAAEVHRSLGEEFGAAGVSFDRSDVEALSESEDAIAARVTRLVNAGILTRGEAKEELALETTTGDDVYLLSVAIQEVPAVGAKELKLAPVIDWRAEADAIDASIDETKHHGSLLEQDIIANAPRREPPPQAVEFANRVAAIRATVPARFESILTATFEELGTLVSDQVMADLQARGEASAGAGSTKGHSPDVDISAITRKLEADVIALYQALAEETGEALGASFGIEFELSEAAQQAVLQEGGLRVGLLDLDTQTRDALFDSLEAARGEGLAGDALARRIRDDISAGPWRDVATRARVIARTEGAHAANTATLQSARSIPDVQMVMVHDNRTGHDDDICSDINNTVITIERAEALGLAHPNCTRSFTPMPAALLQELGL